MRQLRELLDEFPFPGFDGVRFRRENPAQVAGLGYPGLAAFAAAAFRRLEGEGRGLLVAVRSEGRARLLAEDLAAWLGEEDVYLFPGTGLRPYEWRAPFGQIVELRLRCLRALSRGRRCAVVAPAAALDSLLDAPKWFDQSICEVEKSAEITMRDLRETLVTMGFHEEAAVESMGQFAPRGGILDVYPFLLENPVRLEWRGDRIESIREFDIFSQRSIAQLERVEILPVRESCYSTGEIETALLSAEHLFANAEALEAEVHRLESGDQAGLVWMRPLFDRGAATLWDFFAVQPALVVEEREAWEGDLLGAAERRQRAYEEAGDAGLPVSPPQELFLSPAELQEKMDTAPSVRSGSVQKTGTVHPVFDVEDQVAGGGSMQSLAAVLEKLHHKSYALYLLAPSEGAGRRLQALSEGLPVDEVLVGTLSRGFICHDDRVALFSDHLIFNRLARNAPRRFRGGGAVIPDFDALSRGDCVVHRDYGIGRYLGIKRIEVEGHHVDCILLQYRGSDRLTIPVSDLIRIQKYSAQEGVQPRLSKLGGKDWEQLKRRTRRSVVELAKDLIDLYAKRATGGGFAFAADTPGQAEFEEAFAYPLTPDQVRAVAEVKADMEKASSMDRLVCGDVGFGKTEVAMRAAFKAVAEGKQVAVLAPTTVLVSQHFATFEERFAQWPVRVDTLNRFRLPGDQKRVLEAAASGHIDLLIGTHRLLSPDVRFKDLGLLIIDEEQKFGVRQKERLKQLKLEVDVLSLSATPIPRSLHMSLVGARDFSVILTPPRNRLPIDTRVAGDDKRLWREYLERELDRGGQVFFVHNRVADLPEMTSEVESLVPRARVAMAHGQMHERDLERVMFAFIHREFDVLVSTAIIDSGLDLPNVNTMLVHNAHQFGLSQLFQLRGRVGRSQTQAFCLLIAPPTEKLTQEAKRRLVSMEQFTELGSGYQLAMRDLEIRGAGNILGTDQSGHITRVGFDTYTSILREAIAELQGKSSPATVDSQVDLGEDAYLAESYVEDGLQRVAMYQKISRCTSAGELHEARGELEDRFGPPPEPAKALLRVMGVRIACQALGIARVELRDDRLLLEYAPDWQPAGKGMAEVAAAMGEGARFLNRSPLAIEIDVPQGEPTARGKAALAAVEGLWAALTRTPQPA